MNRIRPFLFWMFVFLFFSITSAVLFYTFGYRFNFERGIFVYTGSISIKSTPETVEISVDGESVPQKKLGILNQSIHIGGLTPGEHIIEVTAPGYTSWSKKTTIQSGLSTEFWNVFLVKTEGLPEIVKQTENTHRIFQSRDKWILAIAKERDRLFIVDIINTEKQTSETLFSLANASFSNENEENIEWSPDNKKLLIPIKRDNAQEYIVADIATKQVFSLTERMRKFTGKEIMMPRWDPSNKDALLTIAGNTLYRLKASSPEENPIVLRENVKSYNFSGEDIYYLGSDNGIIYRFFGNNPNEKPVQISTTTLQILEKNTYILILYDAGRFTLREKETGKLWLYNSISSDLENIPMKELAEKDIEGVQFSDDGKKLLFFSKNEISVFFLRDWEAQPIRMKDTSLQIARFSNTFKNVIWSEDYEHIFFSVGSTVKMIEIDHRDKRNIVDLTTFHSDILQILPRFDENFLYFVTRESQDDAGNTVSRIEPSLKTNLFGL